MRVCVCDDLSLEDEVPCVADTPDINTSDCDLLVELLAEGKTKLDCGYYAEYTPPREMSTAHLLKCIRSRLSRLPKDMLEDIYELTKEK